MGCIQWMGGRERVVEGAGSSGKDRYPKRRKGQSLSQLLLLLVSSPATRPSRSRSNFHSEGTHPFSTHPPHNPTLMLEMVPSGRRRSRSMREIEQKGRRRKKVDNSEDTRGSEEGVGVRSMAAPERRRGGGRGVVEGGKS